MKRHAKMRAGETLTLLLAAAAVAVGCSQTETNVEASVSPQAASAGQAGSVADSGAPVTLEFDVPEEFRSQPAGGATAVSGFRVGFFRTSSAAPARTVDVPRNALTLRDSTARVTLPRDALQECGTDCVIRVQTMSGGRVSAWSAPVSLAPGGLARQAPAAPSRPESPTAARTERPRNTPRDPTPRDPQRGRGGLTPADVERYPALLDALRKRLPADAKLETEVAKFRRLPDLALAVVISQQHDIPFAELSQTLLGPPRVAPAAALTKLRPDVNPRDAMRKARAEARKVIAAPSP